jgi:hypothetical protein
VTESLAHFLSKTLDRKNQYVLLHPARIFSVNTHAVYSGLPRRLASANRYGSLLAKTGNEAMVVYKKNGFLVRRCEESSTTFYVLARKK